MTAPRPEVSAAPSPLTIEQRSVDTVPLEDRHYSPKHIFVILFGSDLTFSIIITGSFPILFGLSWWSAVTAIAIGCLVGGLLLAPMSLFGPRTGTNNAVSSGGHFGIAGRFVGTSLALFSALGYTAITIWTSGQAIVDGVARLLGKQPSDLDRVVGYAVISVLVVGICIAGIHLVVWVQEKLMIPLMTVVLLVGVVAFAPHFDASYSGGTLAFANFPATMIASALLVASVILSYGPFVGDWARYIQPDRHSTSRLFWMTFLGGAVGMGIPILWGAFTASTFASDKRDYITALVGNSPVWYVVPLVGIGLVAGVGQGVIGVYGTGLDTSSLIPRLSRVKATLVLSAVAITLVYMGAFVWNAITAVNAFLVLLLVVSAPWIVIMTVGYVYRRGHYHTDDLQVFTRGQRGGRYWFWHGWNWRAIAAWIPASVVGLMFTNAPPVLSGPWRNAGNGVDLSFASASILALVLYSALLLIAPEPDFLFGDRGPGFGRASTDVPPEPITNQRPSLAPATPVVAPAQETEL